MWKHIHEYKLITLDLMGNYFYSLCDSKTKTCILTGMLENTETHILTGCVLQIYAGRRTAGKHWDAYPHWLCPADIRRTAGKHWDAYPHWLCRADVHRTAGKHWDAYPHWLCPADIHRTAGKHWDAYPHWLCPARIRRTAGKHWDAYPHSRASLGTK